MYNFLVVWAVVGVLFTFAYDMKQITLVFKKINTLFSFVVKNIFVLQFQHVSLPPLLTTNHTYPYFFSVYLSPPVANHPHSPVCFSSPVPISSPTRPMDFPKTTDAQTSPWSNNYYQTANKNKLQKPNLKNKPQTLTFGSLGLLLNERLFRPENLFWFQLLFLCLW